jgi:hypothetical protein
MVAVAKPATMAKATRAPMAISCAGKRGQIA